MLPLKVVALVMTGYAAVCLMVWKWQTRLIFMPTRTLRQTPASLGVSGEEVRVGFRSRDGKEELHGFWLPAEPPDPKVMLYFHGNGDNIGVNLPHAALLRSLGISVFLFDYRGYGRSTGPFPSEERVYEDAQAAWKYLVGERHYSPHQIVIYGHSLGGAIAIELASRHPEAACVIVESSFTSVADMARRMGIFRLFPLNTLLRNRFDSIAKIGALRMPVLVLHGTSDWTVPCYMTRQLFAAASQPKAMRIIEGGGHLNNAALGGQLYLDAIREFIR
jgi:pimeloyl-ACP methyl ester carboxylesterase